MIVIADSSPLIVLVNIGHVDVLPTMFGQVTIPSAVATELAQSNRTQAARDIIAAAPSWLTIRDPAVIEDIPLLHGGERAAISLARELNADLLLIDEARGRKAAAERALNIAGTIGVLERAAAAGLLDLAITFDHVKQTDFWVSPAFLDRRLELYRRQNPPRP